MSQDDVTIGEVYRVVTRMEANHGQRLEAIEAQTTKTNGTVGRHDERLTNNDREIKALKEDHSRVVWAIFGLVGTIIAGAVVAWAAR